MITIPTSGGLTSRHRARRGPLGVSLLAALAVVLIGASAALPAQAATSSKAWGGYTNGQIPKSALTQVSNAWLRSDAATAYRSFTAAFAAQFHKPLSITEGYRDLTTQKHIFMARNTSYATPQKNDTVWNGKYWVRKPNTTIAAIPGTSVHGWALASDFGSGVQKPGSPEKKWADANGPKFGWYPVGNSFGEAWHFEFTPLTGKPTPTKPVPTVKPTPTPTPISTPTPTSAPTAPPK